MFLQWIEIWWTKETITFDGAPRCHLWKRAETLNANRISDAFRWSEATAKRRLTRPLGTFPPSTLVDFHFVWGCSGLSAREEVEEPYLGIPLEQLFWIIVKTPSRTLPQLSWGELRKRSFRILWNPTKELLSKQTYNKDTCTDLSTSSGEVQERPGRIKPQGKVLQKLTLFCISNFILHYFMIFLKIGFCSYHVKNKGLLVLERAMHSDTILPASPPSGFSSTSSFFQSKSGSLGDIQLKFGLLPDALIWHPPLLSAPFCELQ